MKENVLCPKNGVYVEFLRIGASGSWQISKLFHLNWSMLQETQF